MNDNTVLIVDDDPAILRVLEKYLGNAGHKVLKASNGAQALRIILADGPDFVITDWEMPEMNGIELCRAVRTVESVGIIYLIILTSHSEKQRVVEAFEAGADDYLSKPFHQGELLARIKAGQRIINLEANLAKRNLEAQKINADLAVLNNKLEHMAATDQLTGLANRRYAIQRLTEYWSMAERFNQPLSCLLLDLDHFKRINDNWGHDTGDLVLRKVAGTLGNYTRTGDMACRLGGEEFLILCPVTSAKAAAQAAERLREAVENTKIEAEEQPITITVSVGVAERNATTANIDDLLKQADVAMYAAKQGGRNCTRIYGDAMSDDLPNTAPLPQAGQRP